MDHTIKAFRIFLCQVARSGKAICHNFPSPIIYAILYSYMVCTVCMCVAMHTHTHASTHTP